MKYEQNEPVQAFVPVVITLTSQAEVNALASVCRKIGGSGLAISFFERLYNSLYASSNLVSGDLNASTKYESKGIYFHDNSDKILGFTKAD